MIAYLFRTSCLEVNRFLHSIQHILQAYVFPCAENVKSLCLFKFFKPPFYSLDFYCIFFRNDFLRLKLFQSILNLFQLRNQHIAYCLHHILNICRLVGTNTCFRTIPLYKSTLTFCGLGKVATFSTILDAENKCLINHKFVCGERNHHFCQTAVSCWASIPTKAVNQISLMPHDRKYLNVSS